MKYKLLVILILIFALLFAVFYCGSVYDGGAYVFPYDYKSKPSGLPTPTPDNLPSSWKGFNLTNMFYFGSTWGTDIPFDEAEFKMISEWGFNFVRLPIDYRILIKSNNWNNINEAGILRIDKAIEYGIKYDIHVCLNFHRAPGYTVASPPEDTDLWTQKAPQDAFAQLWWYLANRYKEIPNEYLSFNFLNEPPEVDENVYAAVIKKAADAIWAQDPRRLLIADGLNWGRKPSNLIKELGIAQATRGYEPFTLTHYKADWVQGSDDFALPVWPSVMVPGYLYGFEKNDIRSIYSIEHDFVGAYNLDINVGTVSREARLIVKADDNIIFNRLFTSGAGEGEWTTVVYRPEWNIYQNIFNRDYRIEIPAGIKLLTLEVTDGDWMTVNDMKFSPVSGNGIIFYYSPTVQDWGAIIPPVKIDADGKVVSQDAAMNKTWLWENNIKQWKEVMNSGGGVMVGEWGAYNKTPHNVFLNWLEDNLQNFQEAGMGWALWNFNGSFGVINSGRDDVDYEDYNGYKIDREMLDILLRYLD